MSITSSDWWKRLGITVPYQGELQGNAPHCVYAAIAGAVNHLEGTKVWNPADLVNIHQPRATDFSVADTALTRVKSMQKHHHLKATAAEPLSPELIRQWLK